MLPTVKIRVFVILVNSNYFKSWCLEELLMFNIVIYLFLKKSYIETKEIKVRRRCGKDRSVSKRSMRLWCG